MSGFVQRLSDRIILTWGWKRYALCFGCGAISALSFAPFHQFYLLFITFPVLVWLLDGAAADPVRSQLGRIWSFFKTSWMFAFGLHVSGLWWIGNAFLVEADTFGWLLPIAIIILPAILATFTATAVGLARLVWSEHPSRILLLALAVGISEYARGILFTGLPWNLIGYAAMPEPVSMQSASLVGVYGISILCIPVFAVATVLGSPREWRVSAITLGLFAMAIVSAHIGYGYHRLSNADTATVEGVAIRIVQPAIPQSDKWNPEKEAAIFRKYLDLSTSAEVLSLSAITHLVWSESAFPFVLTERRDALAAIGSMLPEGTSLITGASRVEQPIEAGNEPFVFNSVYVIDPDGVVADASDKVHLVPFGEYLPYQATLEALGLQQLTRLRGGFEAGVNRKVMQGSSGPPFLPLVCYEAIFPSQILRGTEGAEWLLNVTNDAWFGNTPGPYQHYHHSIIRAVEEGMPLVRAANTGISAIVDAYGREQKSLAYGETGYIDGVLPKKLPATLYSSHGNNLFYGIVVLFILIVVTARNSKKS